MLYLLFIQAGATQRKSRPHHRATALDALRAAKQTQSSTHYLPEPISATPPDISPVANTRAEPNFLSTNFEHTFKTQQLV
jgi:hypothetical protein